MLRIKRLDSRAKSVDLEEVAQYEPPHQDLPGLHILTSAIFVFACMVLNSFSTRDENS